jgi:hypothetical protein
MTKTSSTGVFQLPNGMWGFRYAFMLNGKQKDIKRTKDAFGNPFKTERAAIKAREAAIIEVHSERTQNPTKKRMTVAEVYAEYCETGRCGKAYGTTRKQDSLWKNHISKRFGNRYVDDMILRRLKNVGIDCITSLIRLELTITISHITKSGWVRPELLLYDTITEAVNLKLSICGVFTVSIKINFLLGATRLRNWKWISLAARHSNEKQNNY